ncbi:hypothetical protein Vretifemale_6239 [Volvox reticuliferus]|uniref:Uncharacterized protein n=1 Tax=Volvox reticuliferus TaxID=1737510 RepID=A0A8J4C8C2_9CHLO|nr:hypothetical protein Vretifemale_6239 [Volvox reticuliferus]
MDPFRIEIPMPLRPLCACPSCWDSEWTPGKVCVIDCLGRDKPMAVQVNLPPPREKRGLTRAELLTQVASKLKTKFNPDKELLHIVHFPSGFASDKFQIRTTQETFNLPSLYDNNAPFVVVFRTEHHPRVERPAETHGVPEYLQSDGNGGYFPTWAVTQLWLTKAPHCGTLEFDKLVGLPMMVPLSMEDNDYRAVLAALEHGLEKKVLPTRRSKPVVAPPVQPSWPVRSSELFQLSPDPVQHRVRVPLNHFIAPYEALTWPNPGPVPLLVAVTAPIPEEMSKTEAFHYLFQGLYDHQPWTPVAAAPATEPAVETAGAGDVTSVVETSASAGAALDPCTSTQPTDAQMPKKNGSQPRKRGFEEVEEEVADGEEGEERVTRQRVANTPDGEAVAVVRGRKSARRYASSMAAWGSWFLHRAVPVVAAAAVGSTLASVALQMVDNGMMCQAEA